MVKESTCQCRRLGDASLTPGCEDPLEKEMEPTPVLLPGESHAQRSLEGYTS